MALKLVEAQPQAPVRGNGVTIFMKRQVIVTQDPIEQDQDLINQTMGLHAQWVKDGKPESNQWM